MRRTQSSSCAFFFFNDTATTEIYTLSLHDALPIYSRLHLVENQQQLVLIAQSPQSFEVAGRRQVDAALALDRLDHDGARLGPESTRPNSRHSQKSHAVLCM